MQTLKNHIRCSSVYLFSDIYDIYQKMLLYWHCTFTFLLINQITLLFLHGITENYFGYRGFRWVHNAATFAIFTSKEKTIKDILEVHIKMISHLHDYFVDPPTPFSHQDFNNSPQLDSSLFSKTNYVTQKEVLQMSDFIKNHFFKK